MAGLIHLFRFFALLVQRRFYGEVRVKFTDGQVNGQIVVEQTFVMETLPQTFSGDQAFIAAVQEDDRR